MKRAIVTNSRENKKFGGRGKVIVVIWLKSN